MKKLLSLLYTAGVFRFVVWCDRCNAIVLCRCGVTHRDDRSLTHPTVLHANNRGFPARLNILAIRYHIVSLQAYFASDETGQSLPDNTLLLTLDDGFRNFLTLGVSMPPSRAFRAQTVQANRIVNIPGRGWLASTRLNLC